MQQISSQLSLKIASTAEQRELAIALLQQHNLPTSDIDDDKLLYLLMDGEYLIGTAGLEIFDNCALLRSVSIITAQQGRGYGKIINKAIEKYAKQSGIECMYLLTTTAKDFFERQGYCIIDRNDVPEVVKQTAEFSSLCPAAAVVMMKRI
jgi:amino-acid N-acetyltransferase